MSPNQNIQSLGGGGLYGYNNQGGYGGTTGSNRSDLDFKRIGVGRIPSAEYPDGYLGTLTTRRRDDRLLDSLKNNVNKKAYQRGVHKGERIEPGGYYWPLELQPTRGLSRQMNAKMDTSNGVVVYRSARNSPVVELTPAPHLVNDGKADVRVNEPGQINVKRASQLSSMRPAWR